MKTGKYQNNNLAIRTIPLIIYNQQSPDMLKKYLDSSKLVHRLNKSNKV